MFFVILSCRGHSLIAAYADGFFLVKYEVVMMMTIIITCNAMLMQIVTLH